MSSFGNTQANFQAAPNFDIQSLSITTRTKSRRTTLVPMVYQSINCLEEEDDEGQLLCTERELPLNIEEEIKDGFFELK